MATWCSLITQQPFPYLNKHQMSSPRATHHTKIQTDPLPVKLFSPTQTRFSATQCNAVQQRTSYRNRFCARGWTSSPPYTPQGLLPSAPCDPGSPCAPSSSWSSCTDSVTQPFFAWTGESRPGLLGQFEGWWSVRSRSTSGGWKAVKGESRQELQGVT
jgi:hypothetical protein